MVVNHMLGKNVLIMWHSSTPDMMNLYLAITFNNLTISTHWRIKSETE